MRIENWLNSDYHEFVVVDLEDGRRIELDKGDQLIITVDSITIKKADEVDYIIPAIKVSQILKKVKSNKELKRQYAEKEVNNEK